MLTFLLFTIVMWLGGLAALRVFDMLISPGGAFDEVFGWQNMLKKLYSSDTKWKNLLGKALGDCEKCMSFWFMPLWFLSYAFLSKALLGFFVTDLVDGWIMKIAVGWIWLIMFWSVGALGGLFMLLKARKKDGM